MRRIVVTEFISLDGVIEDPGRSRGLPARRLDRSGSTTPTGMKYKLDEVDGARGHAARAGSPTRASPRPGRAMTDEVGFADKMNSDAQVRRLEDARPRPTGTTRRILTATWPRRSAALKEQDGGRHPGRRQRQPGARADRPRPGRRVPADGVPDRARRGQAAVRRRSASAVTLNAGRTSSRSRLGRRDPHLPPAAVGRCGRPGRSERSGRVRLGSPRSLRRPTAAPTFDLQSHRSTPTARSCPAEVVRAAAAAGVSCWRSATTTPPRVWPRPSAAADRAGIGLVTATEITALFDGRPGPPRPGLCDRPRRPHAGGGAGTLPRRSRAPRRERWPRRSRELGFAVDEEMLAQRAAAGPVDRAAPPRPGRGQPAREPAAAAATRACWTRPRSWSRT